MKELVFAGFGGQGVLTSGLIVSDMAVRYGANATWIPSYGSAMRGGTANCTVKYGTRFIHNPSQEKPDVLMAMNQLSLLAFGKLVKENGAIFVSEMVDASVFERTDVKVYTIPCHEIADEIGHAKGANIVLTGAILHYLGDHTLEEGLSSMDIMFGKKGKTKYAQLNEMAMRRGYEYFEKLK
ncbi:2-oxoacid:acceptor oxidoreductase family protein [Chakrabartyella piscis]|uniref:2-oxoacid:acceptor oxidoreductase family protein n=1 Tax=Chakrabartyella piscis TaxID=2918914 RepID=UPI00295884E5|nr:2-oxoacid:acceptor oxidoreductase family protein [Chakrabartyella piscis]